MRMSFLDGVEKIWSGWEIRFVVLLSLLFQIVLIVLGKRRKYGCSGLVGVVIWAAYMLSDIVPTFSLGVISTSMRCSSSASAASVAIMVFWSPFLLVHLGGPDTVTAYALEDNELWLRHLVGFLFQVGLVFYLLVLSWFRSRVNNGTLPLTYIAIPVFISGVIKYGEKTWVLWSSSSRRLNRTSSPPVVLPRNTGVLLTDVIPEAQLLVTADWLFKVLKSIYAKIPIYSDYYIGSLHLLSHRSPQDAFGLIEIELGFMYDLFFTKASVAHSPTGLILRSISLVSSLAAFLVFVIVVDKHNFSPVDIIITYVLFVVGAICPEIYAIGMIIFSERTLLRLKKPGGFGNLLYRSISACPSASMKRKMWSCSMAQYNLIGFCTGDKPARCGGIQKFFGIYESLEIGRYMSSKKVTTNLKKMIFRNIRERCLSINRDRDLDTLTRDLATLLNSRGAYAIRKRQQVDRFLDWSVESIELDHSILIWHMATDFCYYSEFNNENARQPHLKASIGKSLSDYMLYLVVFRSVMLPKGNWEIVYRKTRDEARDFFGQRGGQRGVVFSSREHACQLVFEKVRTDRVQTDRGYMDSRVGGSLPESNVNRVIDGYWVAQLLLQCDDRWDVITEVWIEMLCYVANKCDRKYHIQELSRGGELLTHVWLLMLHLGLTDEVKQIHLVDYWREYLRQEETSSWGQHLPREETSPQEETQEETSAQEETKEETSPQEETQEETSAQEETRPKEETSRK